MPRQGDGRGHVHIARLCEYTPNWGVPAVRNPRPHLDSTDRKHDAHVRTEPSPGEKKRSIYVDVFNSKVKNATKAHVESESFPLSPTGAREATDFLAGYGFDVTVRVPRK